VVVCGTRSFSSSPQGVTLFGWVILEEASPSSSSSGTAAATLNDNEQKRDGVSVGISGSTVYVSVANVSRQWKEFIRISHVGSTKTPIITR